MTIKGLLVFYVDVSNMPHSAEAEYIKQLKSMYTDPSHELYVKLPDDVSVVFVPQETEETYVDYIPFEVVSPEVATQLRNLKNEILWYDSELDETLEDEVERHIPQNSLFYLLKRLLIG